MLSLMMCLSLSSRDCFAGKGLPIMPILMLSFEALREARVVVRTTLVALKRPFFSILRKVTRFAHPRTLYSNIFSHYD